MLKSSNADCHYCAPECPLGNSCTQKSHCDCPTGFIKDEATMVGGGTCWRCVTVEETYCPTYSSCGFDSSCTCPDDLIKTSVNCGGNEGWTCQTLEETYCP